MGSDRMDLYGWEAQDQARRAHQELAAALLRIKELEQVEAAYHEAIRQLNFIDGKRRELEEMVRALGGSL